MGSRKIEGFKLKICVIGAGISGLTTARYFAERGFQVDVFEKGFVIGGNLTEEKRKNSTIHLHGPHIFHTNSDEVWRFVNTFSEFDPYFHRVKGYILGALVPIPFNFKSIDDIFGTRKGATLQEKLLTNFQFGHRISITDLMSSQDPDLYFLGNFIFDHVFKGYSEKQWGIPISDIDKSVLSRVPINLSYDDRYFSDKYQGVPKFGYTYLIDRLSDHINIRLHLNTRINYDDIECDKYCHIFSSAPIDEFFSYKFGKLSYRSLKFKEIQPDLETIPIECVQTNYPNEFEFTRITRYGMTEHQTGAHVYIAEYPEDYTEGDNHRYYPVVNDETKKMNSLYQQHAKQLNIHQVGRLGRYQYLNMDQAIASALSKSNAVYNN